MIYFDNAATSFPKPREVLERVAKYVKSSCGNPGRSSHKLAAIAADEVFSAREKVAEFLGLDAPEKVVFTQNATHALNMAIKTVIREPCHVLTSNLEHNSVIRPLEKLKRSLGVEYSLFSLSGNLYENLSRSLHTDTKAVISTLASNVTGARADIEALSRFCENNRLKLILDASQLVGHERINLSKTPCSMLCAPGHKALFGLQGSGFAVFCDGKIGESFMEGGSGADSRSTEMPSLLPERYEAGTLATPSIVSLAAGIDYLNSIGEENIRLHLEHITRRLSNALQDMKGITLLAKENGIVLFNADGISSGKMASLLDREGICTRGGLHCAPSAHRLLGTLEGGAVRISLSVMNTDGEIVRAIDTIRKIIKSQ